MADDRTFFDAASLADWAANPEKLTPVQRIALIRSEQRRAWLSGERTAVEEYIIRFPALADDPDAVIDLAYSEYMLRTEIGETTDGDEYYKRFPDHAAALRRQLALHAALQQMTFTSMDTPKAPPPQKKVDPHAPPVFESMMGNTQPEAASAVEMFRTLMQSGDEEKKKPVAEDAASVLVPGYEIISELGRGGMGVVYKARQHRLDRLVALKMILSGEFASSNDRARFREEGIKLARVQHPNIVQIYEVNEHDGRPYFAMEYLAGGSLQGELSGQPLTPRIAARLLLTLADAMHAAHERGIIHRDLKPGNILLSHGGYRDASDQGATLASVSISSTSENQRGPVAKITDFGLAKGIQGDDSKTATGAVLGTPSYMAPEQAKGLSKNVGPAADIYALGAILYECLTGRPPFLAPNAIDTIYLVVHEEPVRPSAYVPKLPPDLETICLKCLEKEPIKRYGSAKLLAEDLESFLDNRPITARPVGSVERVLKWAKRRPAQAALAATLLSVLVLAIGAGVWFNESIRRERNEAQNQRDIAITEKNEADKARKKAKEEQENAEKQEKLANEQRELAVKRTKEVEEEKKRVEEQKTIAEKAKQKAEDEQKRAEEQKKIAEDQRNKANAAAKLAEDRFQLSRDVVDKYFTEVSGNTLLDEPGMDLLRKKLLKLAKEYYDGFVKERSQDPQLQADLADVLFRLGKITAELGDTADGIKLLNDALAIFRRLAAEKLDDRLRGASVARTLDNLALQFREVKRPTEAESAGLEAVKIWEGLDGTMSNDPVVLPDFARSLHGMGNYYQDRRRYPQAKQFYDRALKIRQNLAESNKSDDTLLRDQASTLDMLANIASDVSNYDEAQEYRMKAQAILETLVKIKPYSTLYGSTLARNYVNLGNLYLRVSPPLPKLAVDNLRKAIKLWERMRDSHPDRPEFRAGAGKTYLILAQALLRLGESVEAELAAKLARDTFDSLIADFPQAADYPVDRARVDARIGDQLREKRAFAEAAESYRLAIARLDPIVQKYDKDEYRREFARTLQWQGFCLRHTRRFAEARTAYERSRDAWEALLAANAEDSFWRFNTMRCLIEMSQSELKADQADRALAACDRCLVHGKPLRTDLKPKSTELYLLREATRYRAEALTAKRDFDAALAAWEAAIALDETVKLEYNQRSKATRACSPAMYHDTAVEAAKVQFPSDASGFPRFLQARILALAARTAASNSKHAAERDGWAAQAVRHLQSARDKQFFANPDERDGLNHDKDWEYLRTRSDFQQLISDVRSIASK